MMYLVLSEKILEEFSDIAKTSCPDNLLSNVTSVLNILCLEYAYSSAWILENFHLSRREYDCISLEWLKENIYCCIYPDLIAIDKTTLLSDQKVSHKEREFEVSTTKSICDNFKVNFQFVGF